MWLRGTSIGPERHAAPAASAAQTERGHALVGALASAVFLLAAAGGLVAVASSEERAAAAHRDTARVRYAAEAAAERLLLDLQSEPSWDDVLDGGVRSALAGGAEDWVGETGRTEPIAPATDELAGRLAAAYPLAADTPIPRLFAWGQVDDLWPAGLAPASRLQFAVWVSDDEGESDGDPRRDTNARVRVFALARASTGARCEVEVVIARVAPVPAPIRRLVWRLDPFE